MERKTWEKTIQFRPKPHDLDLLEVIRQEQERINPMRTCTIADAIRLALYQLGMKLKQNAARAKKPSAKSASSKKRSAGTRSKSQTC
jgi:hypothetical protein